MRRGPTGDQVVISRAGGEVVRAFVPHPLPPVPPLAVSAALRDQLDRALLAMGRLDSATLLLPSADLFRYSYVRKEAVVSSQIEGTQSSLSDLLLFELDEAPGAPTEDARSVSNYVAAMEHGVRRLRSGFPISGRLIREVHGILLEGTRGSGADPGSYRRSQNWIGGTRPGDARYVPPPADRVPELMGALERWLHDDPEPVPPLLKAALAHVQFETIHPFLDGNGRVGRLLVTLLFCAEQVLSEPLLYLSLWLKQHRATYYELLDTIRRDGDFEGWVAFFAEGVRVTAEGAVATARRLVGLFEADRTRIARVRKAAGSALAVHAALQRRPITTIARLVEETGLATGTVSAALKRLQELGIVLEVTGRRRNRAWSYASYLAILSEGTEPL